MKFLILALALFGAALAQHHQAAPPLAILRQAQDIAPDGSYQFNYETENGIAASENGALGPLNEEGQHSVVSQGQYQYIAPDGTPISVSYVADENGFQPQGAHLPVAPAIPAQIQRALDYINANVGRDQQQGARNFASRPNNQGFRF